MTDLPEITGALVPASRESLLIVMYCRHSGPSSGVAGQLMAQAANANAPVASNLIHSRRRIASVFQKLITKVAPAPLG